MAYPTDVVSRVSRKLSFAVALAAVLLVTVVFRASAVINATTVGFAYLITVLLVAASWGFAESVVASFAATVCFSYFFLPPVGTLAIADPENWVALFTFLISSLIASQLSNSAKKRAIEASTRQVEMERLYALSRAIMLMDSNLPIGAHIANELARICDVPAVAIYDRGDETTYYGGAGDLKNFEPQLKEITLTGSQAKDEEAGVVVAPLSLGGHNRGSIAIQRGDLSNTALHALLNLVAISLENARSREIATRAEAARQSQEFKSALLDGLAHEFKTPLTSIRAATTALLASSVSDAAQRQELLTVVDQEAERLSRLVTEATHVARIEAGKVQLNRQWHSMDALIENVLEQMEPQRDGRRMDLSIAQDLPRAFVDPGLMQLALRQLLDNALKYSPQSSPIGISANFSGENFIIAVHNEGEPLSETERARVFDRFYRGQNVRTKVAGTGMGLSVARDILIAHGGDIHLHSNERGTEFIVTIPVMKDA